MRIERMEINGTTWLRCDRRVAKRIATYGGDVILVWYDKIFGVRTCEDFIKMEEHFRVHFGGVRYYRECMGVEELAVACAPKDSPLLPPIQENDLNETTN